MTDRLTKSGLALALLMAALLATAPPAAAQPAATPDDAETVFEHVPEAFQEARYLSLPWADSDIPVGRWEGLIDVGWSESRAGFLEGRGSLALVGAARRLTDRATIQFFAFADQAKVTGVSGTLLLRAPFLGATPLSLPASARFTGPQGTIRHEGVGAGWVRDLSDAWSWQVGLLVDRLELWDYRIDFEILSGPSAGVRGTLEHSGSATFVTPTLGVQRSWRLSKGWSLRCRGSGGAPLPPGDFSGRLTTATFSGSSSDAGGRPGRIGDGFVSLGAGLLHRRTGLEFDLGGALLFPVFQVASHAGVRQAALFHVTWHFRQQD
jgi:hypothetical protein